MFFPEVRGFALIPYTGHGFHSPVKGGEVVSNALMPSEYQEGRQDREQDSFKHSYPLEMQRAINTRWSAMGFSVHGDTSQ
jgi:hypothetical protein